MEQLSEKLSDFFYTIPRRYYLPTAIGLIGIVLLIIGLIQLYSSNKSSSDVAEQQQKTNHNATQSASILFSMQVDIEGAVVHPGVYKMSQNARVQDALIAAGGLSASADRQIVAKSLNLAAKLTDGIKVYVPKIGEEGAPSTIGSVNNQGTVLGQQTGPININSASADELDSLSGVGPVTAQKIIAGRPYGSVDDLLAKKVVSQSVFAKIKDKITAY